MIFVSAGMQKAGSGWYFNLTNDLLVTAGHQDVRKVRDRYKLHTMLKYYNCNIGRPIWPKMALLAIPHLLGNTFVVKTHAGPTRSLRYLMSHGAARATYIYRDPRDAAVSAYNHGRKLREQGETHSFAKLETMATALLAAADWLHVWDEWTSLGNVLGTRYEDLLADPVGELERLARFLSVKSSRGELVRIAARYQMDGKRKHRDSHLGLGVHFDRGVTGRYKEVLTEQELALCNEHFAGYLPKMGYQV